MHILLTDQLTCPRCGPEFGLIVLADGFAGRDVTTGWLGCANCREQYPIEKGIADLRHRLVPRLPEAQIVPDDPERAFRVAALLGVTRAGHRVLVVDGAGSLGGAVSAILPDVHVVAASDEGPNDVTATLEDTERAEEERIFSRILTGERLPLRSSALSGVALVGIFSRELVAEAARVLLSGARLVVDPAPADAVDVLREAEFVIRLEQDGVVVAAAPQVG